MTLYGWNEQSSVHHVVLEPRRGWHPHGQEERWITCWSETPPDLRACRCAGERTYSDRGLCIVRGYFDALRHIDKDFMTSDQLRRNAEKMYGLPFEEALEMAYDNMQDVARRAVRGKRRPKA